MNCLFFFSFCFSVVRSLKRMSSSNICTFCPVSSIKKRSFNLLCVLDLSFFSFFFQNAGSQLCFRFSSSSRFCHISVGCGIRLDSVALPIQACWTSLGLFSFRLQFSSYSVSRLRQSLPIEAYWTNFGLFFVCVCSFSHARNWNCKSNHKLTGLRLAIAEEKL